MLASTRGNIFPRSGSESLASRRKSKNFRALADSLDPAFAEAVALIGGAAGRLIICGVGKSGHVARKVSSTFASTGTPSFFLHAAEAGHGDLGIIGSGDVVLILSNSGQSRELLPVLQFIQRRGLPAGAAAFDVTMPGWGGSHFGSASASTTVW